MLTKEQIELVKTTVPVLREHGVALISHFYKRMLSHNPELMQVFNMGHQRAGFQQQALAGSVLAYAENIENGFTEDVDWAEVHNRTGIHPWIKFDDNYIYRESNYVGQGESYVIERKLGSQRKGWEPYC